jgi:sirohydrochlorin ferrochelatase
MPITTTQSQQYLQRMTYEPLTKEQYQGWAQDDRRSKGPDAELFPIYLRQGDLLIQPAGRVHAPYTL